MSQGNFERGHATGWKQTLYRQWWIGAVIAWLMAGCGPVSHPLQPSVGLRPIPPWHKHEYERGVDSLQPMLQWEAFPRQGDFKPDKTGRSPSLTNVTYELRIWKRILASGPYRYKLVGSSVYSRTGLTAANHRVEGPLAPSTHYLWMVRAWFDLNGRQRVTEWSVLYPPSSKENDIRRGWNRDPFNCYSFWTPEK